MPRPDRYLDVLHRSGNVHDSNGAEAFILACIARVRAVRRKRTLIEVRMDSAFFSDDIIDALEKARVRYTISVPFDRFAALKSMVETQIDWNSVDDDRDAFEARWQPKSWTRSRRFILVRHLAPEQRKLPLQLDLFEPQSYNFAFKAIVTNRRNRLADAVVCHEGRGSQEGIFAELKSENALAYVPTRTWLGNRAFMCATLIAHNLSRELTMVGADAQHRASGAKRATLWVFPRISTIRREILQRAGRLIRPQGQLTLSISANEALRTRIESSLQNIETAA